LEGNQKAFLFVGGIILLFGVILGIAWWVNKGRGVWAVLKYTIIILAVVIILGLVIYLVWLIFKQTQIDAIKMNKDRIVMACLVNPPPYKQNLYFKGSEEWENHKIGVIRGICQIKILKPDKSASFEHTVRDGDGKIVYGDDDKPKVEIRKKLLYKDMYEDCIAFKRSDIFFFSWFMPFKVVRVTKNERSSLNSDVVFLQAMAFTPELFGFLYLPSRYRDTRSIDREVTDEINRFTLQHLLKEQINIVQETIAISPRHQKEIEKQNTQNIPVVANVGQPAK